MKAGIQRDFLIASDQSTSPDDQITKLKFLPQLLVQAAKAQRIINRNNREADAPLESLAETFAISALSGIQIKEDHARNEEDPEASGRVNLREAQKLWREANREQALIQLKILAQELKTKAERILAKDEHY